MRCCLLGASGDAHSLYICSTSAVMLGTPLQYRQTRPSVLDDRHTLALPTVSRTTERVYALTMFSWNESSRSIRSKDLCCTPNSTGLQNAFHPHHMAPSTAIKIRFTTFRSPFVMVMEPTEVGNINLLLFQLPTIESLGCSVVRRYTEVAPATPEEQSSSSNPILRNLELSLVVCQKDTG